MARRRRTRFPSALALLLAATALPVASNPLESELGRNEVRILSAAVPVVSGKTALELALPERLERVGYRRVKARPTAPGEYFFGDEVFWIFRRACRANDAMHEPRLIGLDLDPASGRIRGVRRNEGTSKRLAENDVWLEPMVLAESLVGDRADRERIALAGLPESVWRPVLAAEDARFFDHSGVDARAVARAALSNLRRGRVVEGGSTITQQLVKNRDLSPERTLGRKASEAMRALALEADYSKEQILEAYLNTVYFGNVEGLAVHGFGTAARVYFSSAAADLSLAEAAALAAMIQGPNRLSPLDDAKALRERRNWVLSRMRELAWASAPEVAEAQAQPIAPRPSKPMSSAPRYALSWLAALTEDPTGGVVIETTLDPWLQTRAERAVAARLAALRREHPALRGAKLSAALVALDARTGAVLAHVGGDPAAPPGGFDRVRLARRQPGSAVKPLVVLEALDSCGKREPLTASSRIADEPLTIELPSGAWQPENFDREFHGPVLLREALADSRNVPAVRIARWCGFDATAALFERAGLDLPDRPPPAFVLGAVETTPLDLARAYTVFATPGRVVEPFLRPRGATARKVADPSAAYIVRDLMQSAVETGTAATGAIPGIEVAAKTGSSSGLRDAWFAGIAGSVVAVAWVGLDDGARLGLTGAVAAAPLWREFMAAAAPARPALDLEQPDDVVTRWVDEESGLLIREGRAGGRSELYRKGTLPARKRWWRLDQPEPLIE